MKKLILILTAMAAVCGLVYAAQNTALSNADVRDPRYLETWLENNASDAETRLTAAGAIDTSNILLTNGTDTGTIDILMKADRADDAGDSWNQEITAAGAMLIQNDHASKGTLATVLQVGKTGNVILDGGAILDNDTSASILNITEDTIQITGAFAVSADATITGGDITGANGNAIDVGEATDGTITFSRDDAGTVTLTSADSDANAALTVSAGGTGALTVGDSGSTTAITSSDWAIDATGIATGLGNVTSDGTVQGAGIKSASAGITIISGAYTGVLNIVSTTLTFVVNGATTNVLDPDITSP